MPTVTSIITTFNRQIFLRSAIESVLAQTFRDFELLILDNSSTDRTEEVVRSFSDSRMKYVRHPSMTIGQQRNLGLSEARGEFIAFLDDDDEWLPQKLEKQFEVFRSVSSSVALVYGGFVRVDPEGTEFESHAPVLKGKVLTDLLWQRDAFTGSASNPMMRAGAVKELGGYDDKLATSEDWEMYLRLAERYAVGSLPDVVLRIRSHRAARLGDRIGAALQVEELVLQRYGPIMDPQLRSFYLQKIGGKLCRLGRLDEGRICIRKAIGQNPLNAIAYAQYGLSFLGTNIYKQTHSVYKRWSKNFSGVLEEVRRRNRQMSIFQS